MKFSAQPRSMRVIIAGANNVLKRRRSVDRRGRIFQDATADTVVLRYLLVSSIGTERFAEAAGDTEMYLRANSEVDAYIRESARQPTGLDFTAAHGSGLDFTGPDWTSRQRIGLHGSRLERPGLDWTGLDWTIVRPVLPPSARQRPANGQVTVGDTLSSR